MILDPARFMARSALMGVCATLLLTSCGGGGNSGGGGSTPTATPSTANEWTWMSGSSTVTGANGGQPGVYGSQGVAGAGNVPGSRGYSGTGWTDSSGSLWLFGGLGYDSTGNQGNLNDLWEFSPSTNEWSWLSGSNTLGTGTCGTLNGQFGVYGTQGTPATTNVPGGRQAHVGWIDTSGKLWLFGGYGCDSGGPGGDLNDLWEFNPAAKTWAWVGGSKIANAKGVYGTLGIASASNVPGGRYSAVSWTDSSGNFWLFGGSGLDSTGTSWFLSLNDLWEYSPTAKTWTWVSGSSTGNTYGVYGTLGVAAASNVPGGRSGSVSWTDASGNFWLFGGNVGTSAADGAYNDLWEFNPSTKEWTWVSGSNAANASGVYGTQGIASAGNVPGARTDAVSWIDTSGNLWLFGGTGYAGNDLWEFSPTTKMWTWVSGSDTGSLVPVYGTLGVASASNTPGARLGAITWVDRSGNLWLFGSGYGYDSTGKGDLFLNDLWRYQP
jgi:N-acetylneuraminic acid mutarotase